MEAPKPAAVQLDCSLGFEALKAKVAGEPGVTAATYPGEPYAWYNSADQATSYVVTEKGAPGHPAILVEQMRGGVESVSGCPYGDAGGYAKLKAYVESLKGAKR